MVGTFDGGFGEGTLEERYIRVAITVATCRGSMQDVESKVSVNRGHCILEGCLRLWKCRIVGGLILWKCWWNRLVYL